HRERLVLFHATRAVTRHARLRDHLAGAMAGRTGLLDREESLRDTDFAAAVTSSALLGLRPGLRPGAVTGLAAFERRDADLRLGAAGRVFEPELEVVAEVGATIDAVAASAALRAEDLAEDVAERVGKSTEALGPARACGAETHRRIDA